MSISRTAAAAFFDYFVAAFSSFNGPLIAALPRALAHLRLGGSCRGEMIPRHVDWPT